MKECLADHQPTNPPRTRIQQRSANDRECEERRRENMKLGKRLPYMKVKKQQRTGRSPPEERRDDHLPDVPKHQQREDDSEARRQRDRFQEFAEPRRPWIRRPEVMAQL